MEYYVFVAILNEKTVVLESNIKRILHESSEFASTSMENN